MLFDELEHINRRPEPFEFYTADALWTDEHTSERMLRYHLDPDLDVASRNTEFLDRSVDWIASRFDVCDGTRVADFGCGPGLYANRLARRGAHVTGIDFSQRSIEYARQAADREGLSVRYVNCDYRSFETGDRFDLVLMITCDFSALGPIQRKRMLARFFEVLAPGGAVLLDVYSLAGFDQRNEETRFAADLLDGFFSPRPYYGFLNTLMYEREKVVLDKYTVVEPERIRTIYNWLQYFRPEDLEREFTAAGFRIEEFCGDVAGSTYDRQLTEFAVVARRP